VSGLAAPSQQIPVATSRITPKQETLDIDDVVADEAEPEGKDYLTLWYSQ
jgi:hypothetical protein